MSTPDPMDIDSQPRTLETSPNTRILQAIQEMRDRGENFLHEDLRRGFEIVALEKIVESVVPGIDPDNLTLARLTEAYKNKDFTSILSPETPADVGGPITKSSSWDTLHSAFTGQYIGRYHEVFVGTLNDYIVRGAGPPAAAPYSMTISVVQSSGMGKSRLIQAASTLVFTLPINLRQDLPHGVVTYPPVDKGVREYFDKPDKKSDQHLQVEYTIFMTELFKYTSETIKCERFKDSANLASDWADYLLDGQNSLGVGKNREEFYNTIVTNAKAKCKTLPTPVNDDTVLTHTESLKRHSGLLVDAIQSRTKQTTGKMVCMVSFDEAHGLTFPRDKPDGDRNKSPHHNLEKVLTHLRGQPIFFVFLSTNSSLHRSAPTYASHPSARSTRTDGNYLIPPFTELPFDLYSREFLKEKKRRTLERMSTTQAMSVFGRGLWHNHYQEWVRVQQNLIETPDPTQKQPAMEPVIRDLANHRLS